VTGQQKCSNQVDLHLTFIDPIWLSDLLQRPSLTSMSLATDQTAVLATGTETAGLESDLVTARTNFAPYVQSWRAALQEGPSLRCPDPEALQIRRQARLRPQGNRGP
jgi:hypothetical protein